MRLVVDANYFQAPDLRYFLAASRSHIAVLPDIAGMETYKGDPVKNLSNSYKILKMFPRQVQILRGTRDIVRTGADIKNHTRWMEDKNQTEGFALFCKEIERAAEGNAVYVRAVHDIAKDALEHFEQVRRGVGAIPTAYEGMASAYSKADRQVLRAGVSSIGGALQDTLVQQMLDLAAHSLNAHPDVHEVPLTLSKAIRRLPARYAIANYLLFVRKLLTGAHLVTGSAHLESDITDMLYIAYATYFDGVLSKETMVNEVYRDLTSVLAWFD